jgi:hypothetical protein
MRLTAVGPIADIGRRPLDVRFRGPAGVAGALIGFGSRPPPAELAIAPEFRDIYSRIWSDLKDEVREFA